MKRFLSASILYAALAGAAFAQVTVTDPWVRATVPQQTASGAFMKLDSAQAVRLVQARSPAAGVVEIHEMAMENNVMRMRAVGGLDLPAGKAVALEPGGYHLMLMNLKKPLKAGETVPLTLVLEKADGTRETVDVQAPVRALGAAAHGGHGAMPKH